MDPVAMFECERETKMTVDELSDCVRALRQKHEVKYAAHPQQSSLGMVLETVESTLKIRRIVPGGPLDREFDGSRIEEDDLLLAIDGSACAADTVQKALVGDDVVGSKLRLTIEKAADGRVVMVTVRRGSHSRMLVVGEMMIMFKQVLSYGKVVTQADLLKLEDQCVKMARLSSEHLEKLRHHVDDLEKLVLGSKRKAALTISVTQTEMVATSTKSTQTAILSDAHVPHTQRCTGRSIQDKDVVDDLEKLVLGSKRKAALTISATQTEMVATYAHATQTKVVVRMSTTQTEAEVVLVQETNNEDEKQVVMAAQAAQTELAEDLSREVKSAMMGSTKSTQTAILDFSWKVRRHIREGSAWQTHRSTELKRLLSSFVCWVRVMLLSKQRACAARRIALILQREDLALHVSAWCCHSSRKRRLAALKGAAVKAFVRRITAQALWAWQVLDARRRFLVYISRKIKRFWHSWAAAATFAIAERIFVAWKTNAGEIRRDRKEQQRRSILLKRVARRASLKQMHATWNAFEERMEEGRRLRAEILKTMLRWQHANCVQAFAEWLQEIIHQQKLRKAASNIAHALSRRTRAETWIKWRKRLQRCRVVSKVAAWWNSRWVSAAWDKWQAIALEARRRRVGRRRAGLIVRWRWKRRGIRAALRTWQDLVHAAKCARQSAKTVKKWWLRRQYAGVAAVMSAWQFVVLKTRRLQRCGHSVMRTWLRLRIGAAFAGWKAKMLHRKRLLHSTMRWTLNALPSLIAGKELLVWRLQASRGKLQALRLQVKSLQGTESELQQQLRRLQTQHDHLRCIMAMEAETWKLRQMQKSVLDRWQVYATETHQLKNKGLRAVCRMMKIFLFSSLAKWKERVIQDRHVTLKTLKVAQRLMKATLVAAYVRWCKNTVDEKQMKAKALKVVHRLMYRTLVEGFERWRDQAVEEKQFKTKTLKVVHRLMNRTLVDRFERWQDRFVEEKQMNAKALKVVHRLMNQTLVEGFERWRDQTAEEKQMKAKTLKVVQRLMNWALVEGFERWRDRADQEKQMKTKALKMVLRRWNSAAVMAFDRWRKHICEHMRRQKISVRKQKISALRWLHISELGRSILPDAFHAWLRVIQKRHAKLRALHRLSQAWDLFLSGVGRARNMRKVAYSLHIRTTSRQLRCAFEVWVYCGFFFSSYVATV